MEAGVNNDVLLTLDDYPSAGEPMIVMLHTDANSDGAFQFGDGITVPDAPVIEGNTLVALPSAAPEEMEPSADATMFSNILYASAAQHRTKAQTYLERQNYRADRTQARLRALVHQWMYLVERPDRSAAPFADILADDFYLAFSSGPIDTLDGLDAWLKGPGSSVDATRHVIESFDTEVLDDGRHRLDFVLDWNGIRKDGTFMAAKTNHVWTVSDTGSTTFPQIERVEVTVLEPFRDIDL